MIQERQKVDYGQDAPGLLQKYLLWGELLSIGGEFLTCMFSRRKSSVQHLLFLFGWITRLVGFAFFMRGLVMIWSSRVSKVQAANQILDNLDLQGNETILDLGCGRGLLLIEAAMRLPHGKAIGVDLWSNVDQADNSKQATLENAQARGVIERIFVLDGDMQDLSFLENSSIDVVVASKAIHNVPDQAGRRRVIEEVTRVLRPGGQVAIMDIFLIHEFAEHLRACGLQEVKVETLVYPAYPVLRLVTAKKAG